MLGAFWFSWVWKVLRWLLFHAVVVALIVGIFFCKEESVTTAGYAIAAVFVFVVGEAFYFWAWGHEK